MPTLPPSRKIVEYHGVDAATFRRDILPAARPAVLRGLARHWTAVQAALESPAALAEHLKSFDPGRPVRAVVAPPEAEGRFFYNADLSGLNFEPRMTTVSQALDLLLRHAETDRPPALALQSIPEPDALPGFSQANPNPLLGSEVAPRLWIGNAVTVHTHHDMNDNLAIVAGGRRRFTLFPPEQTRNLYIGPFERTPAGPPVSMVSIAAPDLERHPRFVEAWAESETAELEPGDAIFIPYMWWHHVQSLDRLGVLVNYWWNPAPADMRPLEALIHAMTMVRDLPPSQRSVWREMFDAFVFQPGDVPGGHLPPALRGVQGATSAETRAEVRAILARNLSNGA